MIKQLKSIILKLIVGSIILFVLLVGIHHYRSSSGIYACQGNSITNGHVQPKVYSFTYENSVVGIPWSDRATFTFHVDEYHLSGLYFVNWENDSWNANKSFRYSDNQYWYNDSAYDITFNTKTNVLKFKKNSYNKEQFEGLCIEK